MEDISLKCHMAILYLEIAVLGGVFVKRFLLSIFAAATLICLCAATACAIEIDAYSAILIDASTGRVIYEQNAHEQLPPASTTKILTALLTLENIEQLDDTVTAPDDFVNVGESSIYLEAGETLTYRDLLYALMLRSANDAAQLLAIGVAGSEEAFVDLMNQWASEHGLTESTWHNAHGLDNPSNLVSAYDMAMVSKEALRNDFFNQLILDDSYTIPRTTEQGDTTVYNHNQFLELYAYADGVKTGYTSLAKSCLVASATKEGLRLIGVILGGNSVGSEASNYYQEMAELMDYGFSICQGVTVAQAGDVVDNIRINNGLLNRVAVTLADTVCFSIAAESDYEPTVEYQLPDSVEAPLLAGQEVGTAVFTDEEGNKVEVPLLVNEDVPRYTFGLIFGEAWHRFTNFFLW